MSHVSYSDSLRYLSELVLQGDAQVEPYRNNYVGVHAAALRNTFLLTAELLGAETFTALSNVYAQHYPASQWDLNLYGSSLPGFLLAQMNGSKAADKNWPLLSEIAALEYFIAQQYYTDFDINDGGEQIRVDVHEIAKLDESFFIRLHQLHPYMQITADVIGAKKINVWREGIQIFLTVADGDVT